MKNIEINRQQPWYRFFEILPGFTTWSIFILSIVFSLIAPVFFATVVIIYSVYWLLKALVMSVRLVSAYKIYKKDIQTDWMKKCKDYFSSSTTDTPAWKEIYHLVIMATYKESYETLDYSLESIIHSNFPSENIIFVLATEERARQIGRVNAAKLSKKYSKHFLRFIHTEHPKDIPDEIIGKGANITYAAKTALKTIDKLNINYKNILVTTLDADHRPHTQYFSSLTYYYLTLPDRIYKSYQPLPMFFNNIWHVPVPIRSISIGSSFWQMIESTKPYRLRNFAAHAQPLWALIQTNFWSRLTIVEDGHQFWRSYFCFDGNHEVVPINIPIYQDAVLSDKGYKDTFIEQYLQKKRWAWGASDIAYVITNSIKDKKIPLIDKLLQNYRLFEGHLSWSTTSIILFFAGWLPLLINPDFNNSIVAFNYPYIYSRILMIATIGMVVTLSISTLMLPPRPKMSMNFSILSEWIITPFILPFSNVIFSAIPSVHAQTLLMFGKYMGFRVTKKKAIKYEHKNLS